MRVESAARGSSSAVRAAAALLLLAAVSGSACQEFGGPARTATPLTPALSGRQDVTLVEGSSVRLETGERLTFVEVVQDSRCPQDVTCAWVGDAEARFVLDAAGVTLPFTLDIPGFVTADDTLKSGPLGFVSKDVGQYRATLMQLDPYPVAGTDPLAVTSRALVRMQY